MRRFGFGLFAGLLASLLLLSCAPREGRGGGAGAKTEARIILLSDLDAAGGGGELPSFVTLGVVPDGKASYGDRVSQALAEASKAGPASAVILLSPHRGIAAALRASRGSGASPLWILVSPAEDPLASEAEADLVVDLDPAQQPSQGLETALVRGLCELARRASGGAKVDDATEIAGALRSAGGWEWKVAYRVDPDSGIKARNHVLLSAKPRS